MLNKINIEPKNFITNLTAVGIIALSYMLPQSLTKEVMVSAGFFALSGAITNWLAIYMLFEKIPFLYGSGVIPTQFQEFKSGIKNLIMQEFFHQEKVVKFLQSGKLNLLGSDLESTISNKINGEKIYTEFLNAVMNSQLAPMLQMFGGADALAPLKEPVVNKVKHIITGLVYELQEQSTQTNFAISITNKIETLVDARLQELTPEMVKIIIQNMIRKHLGWLVVWGGVFGGLIGVGVEIIKH